MISEREEKLFTIAWHIGMWIIFTITAIALGGIIYMIPMLVNMFNHGAFQ